jgi:hypothetical protein
MMPPRFRFHPETSPAFRGAKSRDVVTSLATIAIRARLATCSTGWAAPAFPGGRIRIRDGGFPASTGRRAIASISTGLSRLQDENRDLRDDFSFDLEYLAWQI